MSNIYILVTIVALTFGQKTLSSEQKSIFSESWYKKQAKHSMPYRCEQKCPGKKDSCMRKCFMDYSQQLDFYVMRNAINDCTGNKQFNEEFNYIDMEKDPKEHIKKVSKPFIRATDLITNESIKQCVNNKMRNENIFLLKMLDKSQNKLKRTEESHPLLATTIKIKACLNEFEMEKPLSSTTEMIKCFNKKFIDKN